MNKTKMWKLSLPALLASAFAFETMPGSVRQFAADGIAVPELAYNFFNLESQHRAAFCMPLAGMLTLIALGFALVVAFSGKHSPLKAVSWLSLAAASLTAVPYMLPTEDLTLQPNVIVTIVLFAVWLIAWIMDRKGVTKEEEKPKGGRRLS